MKLPDAKQRLYIYAVIAGLLSLLVFYGIITPDAVPVWLGFAGIVLGIAGNATAAAVVSKQIKNGTLPDGK